MEDKYLQGTSKPKLQLLLLMALFVLPYALSHLGILSDPNNTNTDNLSIDESASLIYDSFSLSVYISAYLLIPYSMISIYCYILARNTHINRQYPPPGAEVVFKTKVIKDKKALHHAYALYFFSAIMLLNGMAKLGASIYMLYFIKDTLNAI